MSTIASARLARRLGLLAALALISALAAVWLHQHGLAARLLRTEPAQILRDAGMMQQASRIARPVFQDHCATCHGSALQGDSSRGVPDLSRNVWLYGNDPIDIERTILYGIRSGHPKSRNIADMPALGRIGQITAQETRDAVEYLKSLAGAPHDAAAAVRGRVIYYTKGNCFDCHANDARGVTDYGTPALTGPYWLYGGDRGTLYQSIYSGRHGKCPAWINILTPVQIRAMALFLASDTHKPATGVGS